MILIDCFVLSKCNGMSYCLESILQNIPMPYRKEFILLVTSEDVADRIPDGFLVITHKCKSFMYWSNVFLPWYIFINSRKIDSVLFPANTSPFFLVFNKPKFVILHDIMFLRKMSVSGVKHWLNHFYYKLNVILFIKKYSTVFTVSQFSRNDILEYFPCIDEKRIVVIPEAVKCFSESIENDLASGVYFLAVCLSDPRKNTKLCIQGFLEYCRQGLNSDDAKLILFGDKAAWDNIKQEFGENIFFKCSVFFLGRVSDAELAFLYENARCFLFPSSYEGFGLPVLEAMSFGTPVITSKTTSLPEVAGDAGIYINDFTASDIASSLHLLDDQATLFLYQSLARTNVLRFSWHDAVKKILDTLKLS